MKSKFIPVLLILFMNISLFAQWGTPVQGKGIPPNYNFYGYSWGSSYRSAERILIFKKYGGDHNVPLQKIPQKKSLFYTTNKIGGPLQKIEKYSSNSRLRKYADDNLFYQQVQKKNYGQYESYAGLWFFEGKYFGAFVDYYFPITIKQNEKLALFEEEFGKPDKVIKKGGLIYQIWSNTNIYLQVTSGSYLQIYYKPTANKVLNKLEYLKQLPAKEWQKRVAKDKQNLKKNFRIKR